MKVMKVLICLLFLAVVLGLEGDDGNAFSAGQHEHPNPLFGEAKPTRYLLYEVNPGEGFNLRRDVYMRVANMVKFLLEDEESDPWVIVLPPWGPLYHWKNRHIERKAIPWSKFFDLESLRRYVPVMEFTDFLKMQKKPVKIDEVHYLQRFKEGWKDGKWSHRMEVRDCNERTGFKQLDNGEWSWDFWGHGDEVTAKDFRCLSVQSEIQGFTIYMKQNTTGRSMFLVRAEDLIHGKYSEWHSVWWTCRRSMVFAKHLRQVAANFRAKYLDSNDKDDRTEMDPDWTKNKRKHGEALGGPYVAVHLRRRDFLSGHRSDVPSLTAAAEQIETALLKNNLTTVFIATDAPPKEYKELKAMLPNYNVVKYIPTPEELEDYKDGGVAIIDQIIASHARYFMGTSVSTYGFRINEEREILGFAQDTTYNRFCGDDNIGECEQGTKWEIKYD